MKNVEIIDSFKDVTPDMMTGLAQTVLQMSERLKDPAEQRHFEEWKEKRLAVAKGA